MPLNDNLVSSARGRAQQRRDRTTIRDEPETLYAHRMDRGYPERSRDHCQVRLDSSSSRHAGWTAPNSAT